VNKAIQKYFSATLKLLSFGLFLFFLHWLIVYLVLNLTNPAGFWHFHLFLGLLTLLNLIVVIWLLNKDAKLMGLGFMAAGFLKMLASVGFLLPYLMNKDSETTGIVIQFMAIYVAYLVFEVMYLVKLLKK